jgi:hypothetical protein
MPNDARGDSLSIIGSFIWITVAPAPVGPLLTVAQLRERTLLAVFGLVSLVLTVFVAVPGVIVLVALVVVAFVVLALPVFLVPVVFVLVGLNGSVCPPGWQEGKDIGDRTSSAVDDRRQIVGADFQQENSLRRRTSGGLWHRDEELKNIFVQQVGDLFDLIEARSTQQAKADRSAF